MTSAEHTKAERAASHIRTGEISILLATRGRPELLAQSIAALKATTAQKDKTVLWVYVDEDDEVTRKAIDSGSMPDPGLKVNWHVGPRTPGLGETHQAMWNASGRASEAYMISSDKARFDTPEWDNAIRAKLNEYPDGVLLMFAHDPNTADQATYPILGWGWLKTLGYFFPGYFPYWFDDKWCDEIGRMAGRYFKLPIVISPIAGRGRTQRMRGMQFWVRFFQVTLCERKEAATNLIKAMFPTDEAARAQALKGMEQFAATLVKQEEEYSDLYATFQEERHTAMSPEERDKFEPLYFRKETQAVARLITLAQEFMGRGDYVTAMKMLDCTQLSDVRVRWAQKLKVDCLRALGNIGEAERLSKETLTVWPEMAQARRLFRFLGMVANEGKRLVVGMTGKNEGAKGKEAASKPAP
jgi:hypothetical protein